MPASPGLSVYLIDKYWADSTGRRNMVSFGVLEQRVQCLCRGSPAEGLTRTPVERSCNSFEVIKTVQAKIGALWRVLALQAIGVFICAALPWAVRIAEVDRQISGDGQFSMTGHLGPLIPGQRAPKMARQMYDAPHDGVPHGFCTVTRKRRPILHAWSVTMPGHP